jgi:hypothetical protein
MVRTETGLIRLVSVVQPVIWSKTPEDMSSILPDLSVPEFSMWLNLLFSANINCG